MQIILLFLAIFMSTSFLLVWVNYWSNYNSVLGDIMAYGLPASIIICMSFVFIR